MALEVDITKKLDGFFMHMQFRACLLYTSDAADE